MIRKINLPLVFCPNAYPGKEVKATPFPTRMKRNGERSTSVRRPLVPLLPNQVKALVKENKRKYDEGTTRLVELWDTNSYNGSSCYMDRSNEESVNLLASDEELSLKKHQENQTIGCVMIPKKIKIKLEEPTKFDMSLTDDDIVLMQLLEQELEEREARKQREDELIMGMMEATAGYPGSEEEVMPGVCHTEPEMGKVCVWCGEEPCEWTQVSTQIRGYYKVQVESGNPEEQAPPHNILRKRMYRKVAMICGFICRQKHPQCVQLGIHELAESPNRNYMGHMEF
jgi:hypothetical protein